jgi:Fic family protein
MDKPPYETTPAILRLIGVISEKLGAVKAVRLDNPPPAYQRRNRIRTIQSSLEIEGNTLSVEQVTAVLNGEPVVGPRKDILEARNAIEVYDRLDEWKPFELQSLLAAHGMLMKGLVELPGQLRSSAVGIVKGRKIAHLAPPGEMVAPLIKNLMAFAKTDDAPLLLKSCVFHYELEFIHPFTDGNGRMGRLWQTRLLMEHSRVFQFLPVEPMVNARREDYYQALSISDKDGHSTVFVELMLDIIDRALDELLDTRPPLLSGQDRIARFADNIGSELFSRQDYLKFNKEISTATASRDLRSAVDDGILEKTGEKRTTRYRFVKQAQRRES